MPKKHYWVGYTRTDDTIEITVKDSSQRKLESWEFNISDKNSGTKVMKTLKEAYGFSPEIPLEKSINANPKKIDKDLDWLR